MPPNGGNNSPVPQRDERNGRKTPRRGQSSTSRNADLSRNLEPIPMTTRTVIKPVPNRAYDEDKVIKNIADKYPRNWTRTVEKTTDDDALYKSFEKSPPRPSSSLRCGRSLNRRRNDIHQQSNKPAAQVGMQQLSSTKGAGFVPRKKEPAPIVVERQKHVTAVERSNLLDKLVDDLFHQEDEEKPRSHVKSSATFVKERKRSSTPGQNLKDVDQVLKEVSIHLEPSPEQLARMAALENAEFGFDDQNKLARDWYSRPISFSPVRDTGLTSPEPEGKKCKESTSGDQLPADSRFVPTCPSRNSKVTESSYPEVIPGLDEIPTIADLQFDAKIFGLKSQDTFSSWRHVKRTDPKSKQKFIGPLEEFADIPTLEELENDKKELQAPPVRRKTTITLNPEPPMLNSDSTLADKRAQKLRQRPSSVARSRKSKAAEAVQADGSFSAARKSREYKAPESAQADRPASAIRRSKEQNVAMSNGTASVDDVINEEMEFQAAREKIMAAKASGIDRPASVARRSRASKTAIAAQVDEPLGASRKSRESKVAMSAQPDRPSSALRRNKELDATDSHRRQDPLQPQELPASIDDIINEEMEFQAAREKAMAAKAMSSGTDRPASVARRGRKAKAANSVQDDRPPTTSRRSRESRAANAAQADCTPSAEGKNRVSKHAVSHETASIDDVINEEMAFQAAREKRLAAKAMSGADRPASVARRGRESNAASAVQEDRPSTASRRSRVSKDDVSNQTASIDDVINEEMAFQAAREKRLAAKAMSGADRPASVARRGRESNAASAVQEDRPSTASRRSRESKAAESAQVDDSAGAVRKSRESKNAHADRPASALKRSQVQNAMSYESASIDDMINEEMEFQAAREKAMAAKAMSSRADRPASVARKSREPNAERPPSVARKNRSGRSSAFGGLARPPSVISEDVRANILDSPHDVSSAPRKEIKTLPSEFAAGSSTAKAKDVPLCQTVRELYLARRQGHLQPEELPASIDDIIDEEMEFQAAREKGMAAKAGFLVTGARRTRRRN